MSRKILVVIGVLAVVVVNIVIIASLYQKSLAPTNSSASTNVRGDLVLTSPASIGNAAVGSNVVISLVLQNTAGDNAGEIVLDYDPTVLTAVSANETANIFGINKTINATTGKMTIDIANQGPGDLPVNTPVVNFNFSVKSNAKNSTVSLDPATTLGVPNQLTSSGLGSLVLKFILTKCGDGTPQTPNDSGVSEQCDNGAQNGVICSAPYGGSCSYCTTSCTLQTVQGASCGDGTKQLQEQCDSGANNGRVCTAAYGTTCNYCNSSCQNVTVQGPRCGDGIPQSANGEQCDNGATNGIVCNPQYNSNCSYCDNSCKTQTVIGAKCGDGIIQSQEQCDDGNTSDLDSCSATCQKSCAPGTVAKGSECITLACRADYDRDGTLTISDFSVFAQNYRKAGIDCAKDITQTGGVCFLDISDFALFAQKYRVANACL